MTSIAKPIANSERAATAAGRAWCVFACATTYTGEVLEIIGRSGGRAVLLVDNLSSGESDVAGRQAPIRLDQLADEHFDLSVVIPLTTPGYRHIAANQARALGFSDFPTLLDPTAVIARSASIGEGCVVNAMSVIGASTELGRFVLINRSASVGHDVQIGDYATLGPGCIVSGSVIIGRGAYISAGATLAPKVRIGANAVVGAGAVVLRDVPECAVVLGNPAGIAAGHSGGYGDPPMIVPEEAL